MRLDAFNYDLPESLIAQQPLKDRSASRLLVVERRSGERHHRCFRDLPRLLNRGDVLVVNSSRVIPARLLVRRRSGGGAELLVARVLGAKEFLAIGSPLRRLRPGDPLFGPNDAFSCRIVAREGKREVRVEVTSTHSVGDILDRYGHVPLPPYIQRPDTRQDRNRYQTVFASEAGSVAAPTAGLHFDEALIEALRNAGVRVCSVVLHVGLGTFLPLEEEVVEENSLHSEAYSISGKTLGEMRSARQSGHKVIAVGTTVTRLLETAFRAGWYDEHDVKRTYRGETDLFIYPGYRFNLVDQIVTNFHLPQSSLLLLVCAFLGTETTLACYTEAVREKYRFYSYGDAMFIR